MNNILGASMHSNSSGKFVLSLDQIKIMLEALRSYLSAPALSNGQTPLQIEAELDRRRVEVIDQKLLPIFAKFIAGSTSLTDFKREVDGINKRNELWGFKGVKGQMFFNVLTNYAEDKSKCEAELKAALAVPQSEQDAVTKLQRFKAYVTSIGDQFVDAGGDPRAKPKVSSVPFFVSYFWQVQRRDMWPVYYTNTVQMITDMDLWRPGNDIASDYISYKQLHEALVEICSADAKRNLTLYDVEHIFWFKSGKLISDIEGDLELSKADDLGGAASKPVLPIADKESALPDSYIPPIVSIIPQLAKNDPEIAVAAERAGTKIERAFEKSCNAAFTILGYETKLLGQGAGRVPDGYAIAQDESYAILWDAKARSEGYNMGTDDRVIREYIGTQSRELKRRRGLRNIYYLIISSRFADNFDDLIRSLKMETNVNEVCLIEASALVAIVDQKLRSQLNVSLGSDGVQRLFSNSGIVNISDVIETLG